MKFKFALFLVLIALIQQIEAGQMIITGLATIDDRPIPEGTVIVARILDSEVGRCNISEKGGYSITVVTDDKVGSPIEFYVDGYKAIQIVPFDPSKFIVIDLNFEKFELKGIPTTTVITTTIEKPGIIGQVVGFSAEYGATILGILILLILIWHTFRR